MDRQRAGFTRVEQAELLELKSSKMMQLWENGYRLPAASRLKKLIEVYYRRAVFTPRRESQEVHELWTSVKDTFDAHAETYQTYPNCKMQQALIGKFASSRGKRKTKIALPW